MKQGKLLVSVLLIAASAGLTLLAGTSISRTREAGQLHDAAVAELRRGNYAEARGFFEDVLELRPDDPVFLANYGLCLEMLDDHAGATEAYRSSLDLQEDARVLFQLGRATCRGGDPERGVQMMWQANSLVMLTGREAGDLGYCLEKSGRPDQAIPYLERGLQANPDHFELLEAHDRASAWTVTTE
jgi:tetratricopeptide (TPR) repeat protein